MAQFRLSSSPIHRRAPHWGCAWVSRPPGGQKSVRWACRGADLYGARGHFDLRNCLIFNDLRPFNPKKLARCRPYDLTPSTPARALNSGGVMARFHPSERDEHGTPFSSREDRAAARLSPTNRSCTCANGGCMCRPRYHAAMGKSLPAQAQSAKASPAVQVWQTPSSLIQLVEVRLPQRAQMGKRSGRSMRAMRALWT